MNEAFSDALASLVVKEAMAAKQAGDDERLAGVVTDLATMLGKAIAMMCDGNTKGIDMLLSGVDGLIAEKATSTANALTAINASFQKVKLK